MLAFWVNLARARSSCRHFLFTAGTLGLKQRAERETAALVNSGGICLQFWTEIKVEDSPLVPGPGYYSTREQSNGE